MSIWRIIEELVLEEREALALQGFDQAVTLEAIIGDVDALGDERVIGCAVTAKNKEKRTARAEVFYPENWEHEQ